MPLKELSTGQARFIAILARTARRQRDQLLTHVPLDDFGEAKIGRGEHDPGHSVGYSPLLSNAPALVAVRSAIDSLPEKARLELYTLMRVGQGDVAASRWYQGIAEAAQLGDDTITGALNEDVDLHEHIMKALYEIGAP